jgi:AcrR family transcriptional regulator
MPTLAVVDETPAGNGRSGLRRGLVETTIMQQSAELFAARGFAATSLQDIADAVGISRPALYHYVSSKDEILARLTDGLIESTSECIRQAMAEDMAADEQLAKLVRALTAPIAESPGRFRLVLTRDASVQPAAQERLHDLERTVVRSLGSLIERGIKAGAFRRCEPRAATFAILGMINWVAWWYKPGDQQNIDEVTESLVDMALASVRADSSRHDSGTIEDTLAALRRDLDHLERLTKPAQS